MKKGPTKLGSIFAPSRIGKVGRSVGYVSSRQTISASWFRGDETMLSESLGTLPAQVLVTSILGTLPLTRDLFAGLWSSSVSESALPRRVQARRRQRELRWLQTHREQVRKLAGQWIAVEGEEIVAHGPDAAEVAREARAKGVRVPFLYRVEHDRPKGVVHLGL